MIFTGIFPNLLRRCLANEYRGSGVGRNLVIARTRKSADLLDEMNYVGLMECEKVTEDEFVKTFGTRHT
jgi:hypothetical protein